MLADVLGGDKTSRLYRRLVRDLQIAQDVSASQRSGEIAGSFSITVTARPGKDLGEIERLVLEEIERLEQEPPTAAEIARAVARRESDLVSSLEGVSDFGGRADQLNKYNVLAGDPGYLTEDLQRMRRVTPEAGGRRGPAVPEPAAGHAGGAAGHGDADRARSARSRPPKPHGNCWPSRCGEPTVAVARRPRRKTPIA